MRQQFLLDLGHSPTPGCRDHSKTDFFNGIGQKRNLCQGRRLAGCRTVSSRSFIHTERSEARRSRLSFWFRTQRVAYELSAKADFSPYGKNGNKHERCAGMTAPKPSSPSLAVPSNEYDRIGGRWAFTRMSGRCSKRRSQSSCRSTRIRPVLGKSQQLSVKHVFATQPRVRCVRGDCRHATGPKMR